MAGLHDDPRAAAWEKRLRVPVLVAALAVLPLTALSLTHPHGAWQTIETVGHWAVWSTFLVEVAIMLRVVDDRLAWARGHRFELLVVVLSSPLVPLALAVAPALRLLVAVKAFKTLKLAKVIKLAKLQKSVRLLRRKLALRGAAETALGVLALALGGLTALYMVTGRSPLKGAEYSAVLIGAGLLVAFGVNHLMTRPDPPKDPDRPPVHQPPSGGVVVPVEAPPALAPQQAAVDHPGQ